MKDSRPRVWFGLLGGLTPQQQPGSYQGGEMMMMMKPVFWWRKPEYPEETTDLGLGPRVDIEYEVRWPYIMVVVKDSIMAVQYHGRKVQYDGCTVWWS